jgi:cytochrome c biogenesis protein ResB
MKQIPDKIYDALRSVKLAAALIVLIALLAVAGGIVPQGKAEAFYLQKFPGAPAGVILSLGLNHVFSGIPFLLLASIFTVNLTVCSFHRFVGELKKPGRSQRHGPDVLHIGLIILIFGGVLTARTRTEAFLYLRKGQEARLPGGSRIVLTDLREELYPDGRPKSWESNVAIDAESTPEGDFDTLGETGYADQAPPLAGQDATSTAEQAPPPNSSKVSTVKVNKPLHYKGYTIYQQDWKEELRAVIEDQAGIRHWLERGTRTRTTDGSLLLMAIEKPKSADDGDAKPADYRAVFLIEAGAGSKILKAAKGEAVGASTFVGFENQTISGLKIVRDKGYPLVAAGLILVALGAFLTYIRKLKGMFT